MSNALTVVDHKRLAAITTITDAKQVRDEIAALQHYAKVSRQSLKDQNAVACAKYRVERRGGELLLQVPKVQGKRNGEEGLLVTLKRSHLGIKTAYRWMDLARVPEGELLRFQVRCDVEEEEMTWALVEQFVVRPWLNRQEGAPPPPPCPAPVDLLGIADLLTQLGIAQPGDLDGFSPEVASMVLLEVYGTYRDFVFDERHGKTADAPITLDVARLRFLTQEILLPALRAGPLTPVQVRTRLRGLYDDAVRRWEWRQADPKAYATKAPRHSSTGVRSRSSYDWGDEAAVRRTNYTAAVRQYVDAARGLISGCTLLAYRVPVDRDEVTSLSAEVQTAREAVLAWLEEGATDSSMRSEPTQM